MIGELIGREHLLDVALRDDVAHRRPPVAGHHHPAGKGRGDDRGAVRGEVTRLRRRRHATTATFGATRETKSVKDDDPIRKNSEVSSTDMASVVHWPPF